MNAERGARRGIRLLPVAAGILLLLVWASTVPTLSAWTAGVVVNATSDTSAASLAFSHSAGPCSAGVRVTSVACPASPVGTDTITHNGSVPASGLTSTVAAASCGPVQLTNQVSSTRPLLARKTLAFRATDPWGGTNAVALDGASYAGAVTQQTEPTAARSYGLGVWFRAASGASGPMFSFGTNPTAAAGTDERSLSLNANGTVTFKFTSSAGAVTSAAGTSYADGAWHFAYARITLVVAGASTFSLTVDSATPVSTTAVVTAPSTAGYWRLGWAPTALTGLGTAFFTGSLSNLVVFYGTTSPATGPTATDRASQAAFTTWAASATESWLLGDTGTTTYAGSEPVLGTTSPCTAVDLAWTFTNPAGTAAAAGTRLSAFTTGATHAITPPGPGTSQTSTLTISLDSGNTAAVSTWVTGLRLYVPFTYVVSTSPGTWSQTFTWSSSGSVVIP